MALDMKMGLGLVFTAEDLASSVVGDLQQGLNRLTRDVDRFSRTAGAGFALATAGAATMAAGFATLRTGWDFARTAGEFERNLAHAGGVVEATTEQLNMMRDAALAISTRTGFTPEESVQALEALGSGGMNANQAVQALTATMRLAGAGMISTESSATALTSAISVFGLQATDAQMVTDQLLTTANMTMLQANEFADALGTVGRGASLTRQSLQEMLVSIGLIRNTGVSASVSASAVSSALLEIATNAEKFRRIGVDVERAGGGFRDLSDVVLDTQRALETRFRTEAERVAAAEELFGRFGITAYSALTTQLGNGMRNASGEMVRGSAAMDSMIERLNRAGGASERLGRVMSENLEGALRRLTAGWEAFKTAVGGPLQELFAPLVTFLAAGIGAIVRSFQALSAPMRRGLLIFTMFSAVGTIVAGALAFIAGSIAVLGTTLAGAFGLFASIAGYLALALIPIGAILAGWIAIGAALYYAWRQNLGGLGDWVTSVASRISLAWRGLVEIFSEGGLSSGLRRELSSAQNAGVVQFLQTVVTWGQRFSRMWTGFVEGFRASWATLGPAFGELVTAFETVLTLLGTSSEQWENANRAITLRDWQAVGRFIAVDLVGALRLLLRGLALTIQTFIMLGSAIGPVLVFVWRLFTAFLWLVQNALIPFVTWVYRGLAAIARFQRAISPLGLIEGVGQFYDQLTGTQGSARGQRTTATARPTEQILAQMSRRGEDEERTEPATTRPAAAQGESWTALLDQINATLGQAPQTTNIQLTSNLQMNDQTVGQAVQTAQVNRRTGAGRTVADQLAVTTQGAL